MRTSEFRNILAQMEYKLEVREYETYVFNEIGNYLIKISGLSEGLIDSCYNNFDELQIQEKRWLLGLVVKYASTPISEREEEKRYRLKLSLGVELKDDNILYLNMLKDSKAFFLSGRTPTESIETIFTESELKTMDLTGFEKVEVTE